MSKPECSGAIASPMLLVKVPLEWDAANSEDCVDPKDPLQFKGQCHEDIAGQADPARARLPLDGRLDPFAGAKLPAPLALQCTVLAAARAQSGRSSEPQQEPPSR
eukprot:CAMPEP_0179185410 /NCGR_PEP_ID=MMETSP0796-20121207/91938_1 /TAXON_ID=73915 /ORGANISM="Pyrodinium bahamense, Strain pbaha01" /LENGTH=104 /DNA_ID=CAMNT_0020889365 /DNA_START=140 /DNA_END=455 /DNA_ORIENTATION=+